MKQYEMFTTLCCKVEVRIVWASKKAILTKFTCPKCFKIYEFERLTVKNKR